jgi:serine/threonine/tyrosine-interacting protein
MTMFQTMTEEQLRELIQGPQDVEWKCALPSFRQILGSQSLTPSAPSANDDRYEMRRECQEILPGLILGPLQAAKSLDILQRLGVTHVYVLSLPLYSRSG